MSTSKERGGQHNMFLCYMQKLIDKKMSMSRHATAANYQCAMSRFREFLNNADIQAQSVSAAVMADYQTWLLSRDVAYNTVSFYMRQLRAVYNRMVHDGIVADRRPFSRVYTGIARTRKRAIGEKDLQRIKNACIADSGVGFARDMFMLSFYLMGISFVDLAHLKKTCIADDIITYRRAKTGQVISVCVNSRIRDMLERYPSADDSPYLLPIIRNPGADEVRQYRTALRIYNMKLKQVALAAGLPKMISSYTARHSWASLANTKNITLGVISAALGHENVSTTQIYLSSIDIGLVGEANDMVLSCL